MLIDVVFPALYLRVCEQWHGGQNSRMYATSSTGTLKNGNLTVHDYDLGRDLTPQEQHIFLYEGLLREIDDCVMICCGDDNLYKEKDILREFEAWATQVVKSLREAYNLPESE